ncbi:hypothetical protein GF327_02260 [Candidatus Woesearchaeota archaeon]|nr:hypothetical protein [Candidatus Woesearchaeota archaeon]
MKKKSMFFTIDGLFAGILLASSLILIFSFFIEEQSSLQMNYYSKDIVNSLANLKINEINDSYVKSLIKNGNITNINNSVIEQISEFYVLNKTELSNNLSKILTEKIIPEKFGMQILVNDEIVISNDSKSGRIDDLISYRRMVSGFEKFKPLKGATSKVYLEGINEKTFSSYLYFGGFVGQGNISGYIDNIPENASLSELYVELDSGGLFKIFINDDQCQGVFNPGTGSMSADSWNISECLNNITPGAKNNFSIVFNCEMGDSYVGGGFFRVTYKTNTMNIETESGRDKYSFPEIKGIVNLYSSFYVPGDLESLEVFLHYFANQSNSSNNTLYLTIGNTTVLKLKNLTGEENITLKDNNLTDLSYSSLDSKTVPIRLGFENVSFGYIYEGNADVALITDISGSMDRRMDNSNTGTKRNCDDANLGELSTSRLSVAKCLDKDFAENIINITGNEVGLISYEAVTHDSETVAPTTNISKLYQTIGNSSPESGYEADGNTCICCGINSARDILTDSIIRTEVISNGSLWKYNNNYFYSFPPNDTKGDIWYELGFNDSTWNTGSAILGSTNSYIYEPYVDTQLGNDLSAPSLYGNLWEHQSDTFGPPNDFSSGILNTTANTFGINQGNDGWDYSSGVFDYSGSVAFDMYSTRIRIDSLSTGDDVSGAYGIEINVTQEMYDLLSNNGQAIVSFDWWWDEHSWFGSQDEVWVKAAWNSSFSGVHYLGSGYDSGHNPSDSTNEIYADEDPDGDTGQRSFSQSIGNWIEGPGIYYLSLGGKLKRDDSDDDGYWMFDNIELKFTGSRTGIVYANLWEHQNDNSGPPNDFSSSILNSTANTFGINQGNDGWDYSSGVFEYSSSVDFEGILNGRLSIDSRDNDNDVSGAYGIEINITQQIYEILDSENGRATISFDWWWDDRSTFGSQDQVWVKSVWNSSFSGVHYLGENQDSGMDPSDDSFEIYTDEDPDGDESDSFSQYIEDWIEGPGIYYLSLGGKLKRDDNDDEGKWYFDNIQLKISNLTNHYYFRKNFTIDDITDVKKGVLNVLSDDNAIVYLNGNIIDSDPMEHQGEYWNIHGKSISKNYFLQGNNVIAVDLSNSDKSAKFDLKLITLNDSRDKAMMVMTDGQANIDCSEQGITGDLDGDGYSDTDSDDAVQAACDARENYGITVYAVGYSDEADELTLQGIANCGEGIFSKSDNITALQEFYSDVASQIVSASRHAQTIEVQGNLSNSKLYGDSYIQINYTPLSEPPEFGEISVVVEEPLVNCSSNITIPNNIRISNARVTSYSSEHWTDELVVNNNLVYNLSYFNQDYTTLGDPFIVNIAYLDLTNGTNQISIRTGDSYENMTGCSENNTLIYNALLKSSVSYSDVLEKAVGCTWYVEFENKKNTTVAVPPDYTGGKKCNYSFSAIQSGTYQFDQNDTYDDAMYRLLNQLDLDDNGRIFVDLEEKNFIIGALSVGKIPYPWGPAIAEVRVWK